jgi:hypothetical protein
LVTHKFEKQKGKKKVNQGNHRKGIMDKQEKGIKRKYHRENIGQQLVDGRNIFQVLENTTTNEFIVSHFPKKKKSKSKMGYLFFYIRTAIQNKKSLKNFVDQCANFAKYSIIFSVFLSIHRPKIHALFTKGLRWQSHQYGTKKSTKGRCLGCNVYTGRSTQLYFECFCTFSKFR